MLLFWQITFSQSEKIQQIRVGFIKEMKQSKIFCNQLCNAEIGSLLQPEKSGKNQLKVAEFAISSPIWQYWLELSYKANQLRSYLEILNTKNSEIINCFCLVSAVNCLLKQKTSEIEIRYFQTAMLRFQFFKFWGTCIQHNQFLLFFQTVIILYPYLQCSNLISLLHFRAYEYIF